MSIILPNYLLVTRRFKCQSCGFAFVKKTPSRVEKCPMCKIVVYDREYKKGESLDPYSASKERWYQDEKRHFDEIRHRKIITKNGKKVTVVVDDKGKLIEEMPGIPT